MSSEDSTEAIACSAADGRCPHPAKKAGLCWGHWKRKMRSQPLSTELQAYVRDPVERLFRNALSIADAEDETDEGWQRAKTRFRNALRKYVTKWAAGQLKGQPRRVPLVAEQNHAAPTPGAK